MTQSGALFSIQMGTEEPITHQKIYLKRFSVSGAHSGSYTIRGWFQWPIISEPIRVTRPYSHYVTWLFNFSARSYTTLTAKCITCSSAVKHKAAPSKALAEHRLATHGWNCTKSVHRVQSQLLHVCLIYDVYKYMLPERHNLGQRNCSDWSLNKQLICRLFILQTNIWFIYNILVIWKTHSFSYIQNSNVSSICLHRVLGQINLFQLVINYSSPLIQS